MPEVASPDLVLRALERITSALPAGEHRPGQEAMANAVGRAIAGGRHLLVQAGTGTGKSLAYLVPAVLSGKRTVIATATKALQDQLVGKDLPMVVARSGRAFTFAVLKGRSNYVCLQRLREVGGATDQLSLDGVAERLPAEELGIISAWAAHSPTGDRADLDVEPVPSTWAAVSVSSRECPGAQRCPQGDACFAERARRAADEADVVVVNLHLYGLHLESSGAVLPEHEIVVIDEAHQLEDVISATFGVALTAGRFVALARVARAIVDDRATTDGLESAGRELAAVLVDHVGRRLRGKLDPDIAAAVTAGRLRLEALGAALRNVPDDRSEEVTTRRHRAVKAAGALAAELDAVLDVPSGHVAWVEGPDHDPALRVAPVDVGPTLAERLWDSTTAVLTSATIPAAAVERLGLPAHRTDQIDVGSPFDFGRNALLYCAAHLPDPRQPGWEAAAHDELAALITAAGGRTLALFTSWRAMEAALITLRGRLDVPVLGQRDLPKPALVERFTADHATCLFATMGFWQGVDVPGATLSLVTIDKIPFPRPDEALTQARREAARAEAFRLVDLPRAQTLLAQGAGRLIRTASDRGVVAVLDPRLATARYRWDLVRALPPMRRTRDRAETEAFLRQLSRGDA